MPPDSGLQLPNLVADCMLQVDDLRGSPMTVGSLEEIIDEK